MTFGFDFFGFVFSKMVDKYIYIYIYTLKKLNNFQDPEMPL